MDLEFDDAKLQKCCQTDKQMVRAYGPKSAKKLQARLNALRSLEVVADLWDLPGRWHVLTADRAGHFAADLDHPYRLIVRPTPPVPRMPDDSIDWTRVRAVTVVEVFDYH